MSGAERRFIEVESHPGVAFVELGPAKHMGEIMALGEDGQGNEWDIPTGEYEEEDDPDRVRVRAYGDDRVIEIDVDDIGCELTEDEFCTVCGQIRCEEDKD